EDRIAAGVIAVPVRVEEEGELPVGGDALDRGADLVGERRELIVDDEDAVGPREHADVAAGAREHPDVAGDLRRLALDLREAVAWRRRGERGEGHEPERETESLHHRRPPGPTIILRGEGDSHEGFGVQSSGFRVSEL